MSEETIFQAALEKDPAERAAFLETACGADEALRRAVESLLASHEEAGGFLDRPAYARESPPIQAAANIGASLGAKIGPYTLERLIGEGGMGQVWVAKQTLPIKRRVALKLIKAGMDSSAVVGRFDHERQALALMDHPNIARVVDGSITAEGRPYFVMELVNGLPLTKFCDEAKLTPRERLELFVPICQAVQHAHQKGIVHRDLKPANILVTLYDAKPVPKIIDFGVAKALAGKLTDATLTTHFGGVVGTLEYIAPEQAGFSALDVDTRADIYALGVILYELLTGRRPIDGKRLRSAAIMDMIRILQEDEPQRPSKCLSTDEALPSLAALRQMEPRRLTAMLRGDLDWIVMKCLEKSRDRRYETANSLVRDIQRYLADEPVEARPPSLRYRAGKFLRRNRGTVVAATLVMLALVGGIIGTTTAMFSAWQHAAIAKQAAEDLERAAAAEAAAKSNERAKLWGAYLSEANARMYSGRVGQRFESLKAIRAAAALPIPEGRSRDELRNAAIAALCLPDVTRGPSWDPKAGPAVPDDPGLRACLEAQQWSKRMWAALPDPKYSGRGNVVSPNRRFVLAALQDYHHSNQWSVPLRLWRVDGDSPERILDAASVREEATAFSRDSRFLVLGHLDGTVTLYATESGQKLRTLRTENGRPFCAAFHPTLPRFAVGAGTQALIWDLDGHLLHKLSHPKNVNAVVWRPDGRQLAAGNDDQNIYLWDAESGKPATPPWRGHQERGIRLWFNLAGDRVVSNDYGAHLHLWDTRSGRELFRTPEMACAYADRPGLLGPRSIAGGSLHYLQIAEGHELRRIPAVAMHSDHRLAGQYDNNVLRFFSLASGEAVGSVRTDAGDGITFDDSGALWSLHERFVCRWPVRVTAARYDIGPPEKIAVWVADQFASDRSGSVVAFPQRSEGTRTEGTLVIHRHERNRAVRLGPQYDVRHAWVSPDGRWVATQSFWNDGKGVQIKVWEASSGKLVKDLPAERAVWCVGFSPDGRWLVTRTEWPGRAVAERTANYLCLWEVGTWKEADTLPGLGVPFWEQDVILEGQRDGSIVITQISTRKELARLSSPETGRIDPHRILNSGFVLAGGESGAKYLWDLPLIRSQLAELGLDWDGPPHFPEQRRQFARSAYSVRVDPGFLAVPKE
jgi:serine/threonine protein kinase/WD40 repeat protein